MTTEFGPPGRYGPKWYSEEIELGGHWVRWYQPCLYDPNEPEPLPYDDPVQELGRAFNALLTDIALCGLSPDIGLPLGIDRAYWPLLRLAT
jgi:hypothetical protein